MMTSNVRSGIEAPKFCNLKLYNDGYKVSVSLHVSSHIYDMLVGLSENGELKSEFKPILYRAKYYIHWDKSYNYMKTSFDEAYADAWRALRVMQIIIREQKIASLHDEINFIVASDYNPFNPLMSL